MRLNEYRQESTLLNTGARGPKKLENLLSSFELKVSLRQEMAPGLLHF